MTQPATEAQLRREAVLREMAAKGGVRHFPAQMVLIHQGDDANTLFIMLSGRVKVYAANAQGKEVVLRTHGPGDYFGELALDGGQRSASVMTLEATSCAVVSGGQLRAFIVDNPDFATQLMHDLMRRVRALTDSVKSLALDDVYSRVVALLVALSPPAEGAAPRRVGERLTQQDIAERVGSSREMVSRIFKELTQGGYIQLDGGRITLLKTPPAAW